MLELKNVSYHIGSKALVERACLRASPGALTAIVGPNGAGKSTLLKLASGELHPTHGTVLIDGAPVCGLLPVELAARRAVVPQSTELAFPFEVDEVVALGARVPGFALRGGSTDRHVREALENADIGHLAHRFYPTLSGGERQRVHLARALCQLSAAPHAPSGQVLLLDEPTASLDLAHQLMVFEQARRVARQGTTVVAVLHDLNLAATYADTIVLMARGRIMAHGTARDVMTDDALSSVFDCAVKIGTTNGSGVPYVIPQHCRLGPEIATERELRQREATP